MNKIGSQFSGFRINAEIINNGWTQWADPVNVLQREQLYEGVIIMMHNVKS